MLKKNPMPGRQTRVEVPISKLKAYKTKRPAARASSSLYFKYSLLRQDFVFRYHKRSPCLEYCGTMNTAGWLHTQYAEFLFAFDGLPQLIQYKAAVGF
jgi:hypothetical protein